MVSAPGPYTTPDSVFYLGLADRVAHGQALAAPPGTGSLGAFPPLYPLTLAALVATGVEPMVAARWVGAFAFGAAAFLVALVAARRGGSVAVGLVAGLVYALSFDLYVYAGSALSEPVFVLLTLGALVGLAAHLRRPTAGALALAVALATAAALTRYAGVALALAGAAALVRAGRRREAVVFGVVPVAAAVAWTTWAGGSGRAATFNLIGGIEVLRGFRAVSRWFLPVSMFWPERLFITVLLVAVAGGLAATGHRRRASATAAGEHPEQVESSRAARDPLSSVVVLFTVAYLGVLVAYRVLLDASGRLDGRLLTPLQAVAVLAGVPALAALARRSSAHRILVTVAGVGILAGLADQAFWWVVRGRHDDGLRRRGYAAAVWQRSEVIRTIAALDPHQPVYSNGPDVVFLLTGRPTHMLPQVREQHRGRPDPSYPARLRAMAADVRRSGGVVVYFHAITARRSYLPSQPALEASLPLVPVRRDGVGVLYRLGEAGHPPPSGAG